MREIKNNYYRKWLATVEITPAMREMVERVMNYQQTHGVCQQDACKELKIEPWRFSKVKCAIQTQEQLKQHVAITAPARLIPLQVEAPITEKLKSKGVMLVGYSTEEITEILKHM